MVHVLHFDVDRVVMGNVLGEDVVQVFFDGSLMVVPERQDVLDDPLLRYSHLCECRHERPCAQLRQSQGGYK